jgi:hypothetical protein
MLLEQPLNGIAAEPLAEAADEEGIAGRAVTVFEVPADCSDALPGERCDALLAALSVTTHAGTAAIESKVLDAQMDELGDAESGLDREREDGVVASPELRGLVWRRDDGFDFETGEESDQLLLGAFVRDRENALEESRATRLA